MPHHCNCWGTWPVCHDPIHDEGHKSPTVHFLTSWSHRSIEYLNRHKTLVSANNFLKINNDCRGTYGELSAFPIRMEPFPSVCWYSRWVRRYDGTNPTPSESCHSNCSNRAWVTLGQKYCEYRVSIISLSKKQGTQTPAELTKVWELAKFRRDSRWQGVSKKHELFCKVL